MLYFIFFTNGFYSYHYVFLVYLRLFFRTHWWRGFTEYVFIVTCSIHHIFEYLFVKFFFSSGDIEPKVIITYHPFNQNKKKSNHQMQYVDTSFTKYATIKLISEKKHTHSYTHHFFIWTIALFNSTTPLY